MRKALIGLMAAATALTPFASASAQSWRDRGNGQNVERQEQRGEGRGQRGEERGQRGDRQSGRAQGGQGGQAQTVQRNVVNPQQRERGNFERRIQQRNEPARQQFVQPRTDRRGGNNGREGLAQRVQQIQQAQNRQGNRDNAQSQRSRNNDNARRDGNRGNDNARRDGNRGNDNRRWDNDRNNNRSDWNNNRSGRWDGRNYNWNRNGRTFSWNHDWRNDRRYNWQDYRRYNRAIFHLRPYYAPYRGYRYNRFSIGFFLEPLFFSSNYWIADPWQYRLPPAYPGTRWVRYYDDALLVDSYTGEVIDVIYDFFW